MVSFELDVDASVEALVCRRFVLLTNAALIVTSWYTSRRSDRIRRLLDKLRNIFG